ncbi:MAG: hypothetical protein NXI22_10135 [bacterium]|nr:hypothetical protein [bacterium]
MSNLSMQDRAAVLLSLLGNDAVQPVLAELPADQQGKLRQTLAQLESSPPTDRMVDLVLADFERFFAFASKTGSIVDIVDSADDDMEASAAEMTDTGPFELTDDPIADLNRMEIFRIAGALQDEQPRTVAVVLQCLPPQRASQVLERLSSETRSKTAFLLAKPNRGAVHLIERIVRTTVEKGCEVEPESDDAESGDGETRIAALLRSSSREVRDEMLTALEESDSELAGRVAAMLYVFEDIKRIESRSLQNLLREVEVPLLAKAMTEADPLIIENINNNLAKRARETLKEEIELMGRVTPEEITEARQAIAAEIARLDKEGQLTMTDE